VATLGTWPVTAPALSKLALGEEWNVLGIFGEHAVYSALVMFAILCTILVRRSMSKLEL
jgi:hypothetical protein